MELQNGSHVDQNFKAFYSDVLFKTSSADGNGYLYFLLEHQSTNHPRMVGRLLQYIGNIMVYDMKRQLLIDPNRSDLKVPVIYPFVLCPGKTKYKWPKSSSIEVDGLPILDSSSSLIELQEYSFEDLLKSEKATLVQFILKESWKKDFCKVRKKPPQLDELINNSPYEKVCLYLRSEQGESYLNPNHKIVGPYN